MDYRFGNSNKVNEQGTTNELICPKCGKKVEMSVFTNSEGKLDASFPFFKSGNVFILVCPECASVYTVDRDKGELFKKGEKLAIGDFDLKEPEKFEA